MSDTTHRDFPNGMTASYDREAAAVYIDIVPTAKRRFMGTLVIDRVLLDVDENGALVGVEVLL